MSKVQPLSAIPESRSVLTDKLNFKLHGIGSSLDGLPLYFEARVINR